MRHAIATLLAATSLTVLSPGMAGAQSINERQANLDARIDSGVRDRSLTPAEAAQLRGDFADLARLEARYRATGGVLSNSEKADLDRRFDLLSSRVRYDRHDRDARGPDGGAPDLNINQRQRDLEARIDAGVRNGGLTAREASDLRAEFKSIARQEAQYRESDRRLTASERAGLEQRLDRLDRRVVRDRADDDRRWSNLDQRQSGFDQRLDQAVRERRVSAREAQNLRVEFRNIARLERQYRRSRPGITPAERADLNRRFDRMESDFRASMTPSDNIFDLLLGLTR